MAFIPLRTGTKRTYASSRPKRFSRVRVKYSSQHGGFQSLASSHVFLCCGTAQCLPRFPNHRRSVLLNSASADRSFSFPDKRGFFKHLVTMDHDPYVCEQLVISWSTLSPLIVTLISGTRAPSGESASRTPYAFPSLSFHSIANYILRLFTIHALRKNLVQICTRLRPHDRDFDSMPSSFTHVHGLRD